MMKNGENWQTENDLVASGANIFSKFKIPCIKECLLYMVVYPKVSGEAPEKSCDQNSSKNCGFFAMMKIYKTIKSSKIV